jgi:hypothetical protein
MYLKTILYAFLFAISFGIDVVLGTSSYPKALLIVCAIVGIYEFVSPHVYSSS